MGASTTLVAPLDGDVKTGTDGLEEGEMESTNALSKLNAFTLPRPVAKSQPGAAA
jgi:hypothetical protein